MHERKLHNQIKCQSTYLSVGRLGFECNALMLIFTWLPTQRVDGRSTIGHKNCHSFGAFLYFLVDSMPMGLRRRQAWVNSFKQLRPLTYSKDPTIKKEITILSQVHWPLGCKYMPDLHSKPRKHMTYQVIIFVTSNKRAYFPFLSLRNELYCLHQKVWVRSFVFVIELKFISLISDLMNC